MIKTLKSKSRILLFALLTVFSFLLLGAAKINSNTKLLSADKNHAVIQNLLECNKQLCENQDTSWREIMHKNPMLMLCIETAGH